MSIQVITRWFANLSRVYKRGVMAVADAMMLFIALWSAFSMRFGELYLPNQGVEWLFVGAPFLAIPVFIRFGLYRAIVRYIGFHALWAVLQAVTLYALLWALLVLLSGVPGVPRTVTVMNWVMAILLVGGSRMVARWWFAGMLTSTSTSTSTSTDDVRGRIKVAIYGAGSAGVQLATALSYSREFRPVAFIDDDSDLHNRNINALRVYPFTHLGRLIADREVDELLLAMPSCSRSRRHEIITLLEPYPVHVRTLPGVAEMAQGRVKVEDIREVTIEDLLGRDAVAPHTELLHANVKGKAVMVTGAGGSIGSELCRQLVKLEPAALILFEQNEYALYTIEKELLGHADRDGVFEITEGKPRSNVVPILGTVLDSERLTQVVNSYGIQTIYHAAAYKHVPMVERNPVEAIKNNIIGTWRSATVAKKCDVETFVLISTDKAVRPTNSMGATKRFAELVLQGLAKGLRQSPPGTQLQENRAGDGSSHYTRFCMVRFGNVLDSSGSVVPLFREQIGRGGPVTVTDSKIIRYFMTIPEAAQLVIQAGAMGQGGDVFVLDMGEPVKILDLARKMIRLSGFEVKDDDHPKGDIEIRFTGLRPGEKLYEELLIGDNVKPTEHPLIMRAEEEVLLWEEVQGFLDEFDAVGKAHDQEKVRSLLLDAVSGFRPQCGIEDELYKQNSGHGRANVHVLNL
ncbi:MAG: nucleoside-diphosphate sugar epimerase/dehydratase [Candidatus Sedimenticola sp. (ex Thyasira tokunagai)]